MVSSEQAKAIDAIVYQYPDACWIVALHHHLVEYPKPVKKLSDRIGTALINGSWLMRHLGRLSAILGRRSPAAGQAGEFEPLRTADRFVVTLGTSKP